MNMSLRFAPQSTPLAHPIAGVQLLIHRTCWPLALLFLLHPPLFSPPGIVAQLATGLAILVSLVLASLVQLLGAAWVARRARARLSTALLFPFGLVLTDRLDHLPLNARVCIWLAGPLCNLTLGNVLALSGTGVLSTCGHLIVAFGLFSLAPCYPMPGGLLARELFNYTGGSATDVDRQTLKRTRAFLCLLVVLGLLNFSLILLYAIVVLWVVAHFVLVPGADLRGVRATTLAWLRDRWRVAGQWVRGHIKCLFWIAVFAGGTSSAFSATGKRESTPAPWIGALEAQTQRILVLESQLARLRADLASLQRPAPSPETNELASFAASQRRINEDIRTLSARLGTAENTFGPKIKALEDGVQSTRKELTQVVGRMATTQQGSARSTDELQARLAECNALVGQLRRQVHDLQTNTGTHFAELRTSQQTGDRERTLLRESTRVLADGLVGLGLMSAFVTGGLAFHFHRRLRQLQAQITDRRSPAISQGQPVARLADSSASVAEIDVAVQPEATQSGDTEDSNATRDAQTAVVPVPPSSSPVVTRATLRQTPRLPLLVRPIPEPELLLQRLITTAQGSRRVTAKPRPPRDVAWNIGWATRKGPVRPKNEDFVLAFEIARRQVVIVADGVSGEPHGGTAAFLACQSAAWSITRQLGRLRAWDQPDPSAVASLALEAASRTLGKVADAFHRTNGLRTTLIIVIASPKAYGYAYIGDGKGCVLRTTGTLDEFLMPQRASSDAPNVLAACLGPRILGAAVSGLLARHPGDLLIVGTDGVFTESVALGKEFFKNLLGAALHFQGDLQRTVASVLDELCMARDQFGFLFDDNLSLVLVGDGQRPQLAPGFWSVSTQSPSEDAQPGRMRPIPAPAGPPPPGQETVPDQPAVQS